VKKQTGRSKQKEALFLHFMMLQEMLEVCLVLEMAELSSGLLRKSLNCRFAALMHHTAKTLERCCTKASVAHPTS
jgi:hypothetical protein